jgi:electron transport complex protein RnfC
MLKKLKWGIHPDTHKVETANKPIENADLPAKVIIPIRQHIGAPAVPVVAKGDHVKKGQLIASAGSAVSSNVHASISGQIIDIANAPHPIHGECLSIIIENDGLDQWADGVLVERKWEELDNSEILEIIKDAGIVGMGGATFPTHVKLLPPKDKKIDTLIINAAECEPFLTVDHRAMLEYPERIATGIKILKKLLSVENVFVGIEDNKMDAIKVMKEALGDTATVVAIPTRYPQGAEKVIINTLIKRKVPPGRLPMDVGVVVQNVATAAAIADAVTSGIPLIERAVTISGGAINEPKNLSLRIGTTFAHALDLCGGFKSEPEKIIMGGPMMGIAQYTSEVPIIKGTSGILVFDKKDVQLNSESACIRCGQCLNACPMNLNPSMLGILGEKAALDEALKDYHLLDCFECGCCSYSCPAKRKNLHYIRYLKKLSADRNAKNNK